GTAAMTGNLNFNLFGTVTFATSSANDSLTIGDASHGYSGGSGTANTTAVSGAGTVVLPFSNAYAGSWRLDGGTLRIGNSASLGTDPSAVVINSATLEIAGVTLDRALTLNN